MGQAETPAERMVQLVKWYMSGWHYKLPVSALLRPPRVLAAEPPTLGWGHCTRLCRTHVFRTHRE